MLCARGHQKASWGVRAGCGGCQGSGVWAAARIVTSQKDGWDDLRVPEQECLFLPLAPRSPAKPRRQHTDGTMPWEDRWCQLKAPVHSAHRWCVLCAEDQVRRLTCTSVSSPLCASRGVPAPVPFYRCRRQDSEGLGNPLKPIQVIGNGQGSSGSNLQVCVLHSFASRPLCEAPGLPS